VSAIVNPHFGFHDEPQQITEDQRDAIWLTDPNKDLFADANGHRLIPLTGNAIRI